MAFGAKLSKVFVWKNFSPERTILTIRPRKEVWGRFRQKIPIENEFFGWTNIAPGHFCPQPCHLFRLAKKICEVRFCTKIQTENVCSGKIILRGLVRQNSAKFSSETILPLNAPCSQLGPEKRYGAGFIKKLQLKTCFLGWTKFRCGTLLPPIAPSIPFGQENR